MDENETLPVDLDTFVGVADVETRPLPTIGDVGVIDTVSDFTIAPGLPLPPSPPSSTVAVFLALGDVAFDIAPPKNLVADSNNPIAIILYYRLI